MDTKKKEIIETFQYVRSRTEQICEPLLIEDYVIQSMSDVSPPKWHLAHTTWFFETFLLKRYFKGYREFQNNFQFLFNSYYNSVGKQYPRGNRGLLSRPSVKMIYDYRLRVNQLLINLIEIVPEEEMKKWLQIFELGLQHEQQHQELLLMDIKFNFSVDPNFPSYKMYENSHQARNKINPISFYEMEGGIVEIGHESDAFCFDIELPRHKIFLRPYAISNRLVTNGEYYEFMLARGYQNPNYWLADGWDHVQRNGWCAPLYWLQLENEWYQFTLSGLKLLNFDEPVIHISYYEADAFARWQNKRLPLEAEWEHFVVTHKLSPSVGNFFEQLTFHPWKITSNCQPQQFFGDVWEWTATPYGPYPGFKPIYGEAGEYNGKFMNNQMILRGGCCITPSNHIRASYRNFFQPDKRWQFSGIRLAEDVGG